MIKNIEKKTKPFDISAHLQTEDNIRDFLDIMLEENGIEGFQQALGHVAKAKGMTEIANKTNLSRSSLYKSLTNSASPSLDTIDKVIHALGLRLSIEKVA